jgi:hypothetical protein
MTGHGGINAILFVAFVIGAMVGSIITLGIMLV